MEFLRQLFENLIGLPSAAIAATLVLLAVYRMARHSVLIFGNVQATEPVAAVNASGESLYDYSFFVQNVEDVDYPEPLYLKISSERRDAFVLENLEVFAGPKQVEHFSDHQDHGGDRTFCVLRFASLPPYDTWRINCRAPACALTLSLARPVSSIWRERRLVIDIWPKSLTLEPGRVERHSVGSSITPGAEIWWVIWPAMIVGYFSLVWFVVQSTPDAAAAGFAGFGWEDMVAIPLLSLLLWAAYKKIQRPVYPIIQGYLQKTRLIESGTTSPGP